MSSLKATLVLLALLAGALVVVTVTRAPATWAIAVPCALLAVNLGAAVATHPAFRRNLPLLVFHLALAAVLALAALGRMTSLTGELELSTGEAFAGTLTRVDAAPWHRSALAGVRFANAGYTIEYAPGRQRAATANRLLVADARGAVSEITIGDNVPLVAAGYRFYTSFNKGFAPVVRWQPAAGGAAVTGTIHMPAYPLHEHRQAQEWTPPGARTALWVALGFDEVLLDPAEATEFRLPRRHTLVVREGARRVELAPGESAALDEGRITYGGLTTWMGYTVFSDWTLPWLFAAAVLAAAALAWHFAARFAARPWAA